MGCNFIVLIAHAISFQYVEPTKLNYPYQTILKLTSLKLSEVQFSQLNPFDASQ